MRWQHEIHFWRLIVTDALLVIAATLAAYFLRFSDAWIERFPLLEPTLAPKHTVALYAQAGLILAAFWVFFLERNGEYRNSTTLTPARFDRHIAIFSSGFNALVFLFALSNLWREMLLSRYVYALAFLFSLLALCGWREIGRYLRLSEYGRRSNVLLFGDRSGVNLLRKDIAALRELFRVVGQQYDSRNEPNEMQRLERKCRRLRVDKILVPHSVFSGEDKAADARVIAMVNLCESLDIGLYMIPATTDINIRREEISTFTNMAFIRLRDAALHPFYRVAKRLMDLCVALPVVLLGSPLWLLIAVIIKLQDGGPVLYRQKRIGLHGREYWMYKFRTMRPDADNDIIKRIAAGEMDENPVFNIRHDPRVTRAGWWLRRSSLDEIPQLFNVLLGQMSIVGPRPERQELVEKYNPVQRRRLKVKPGLTGLQQVAARGEPDLSRRLELDLLYMNKQCFWLDIYIILKTFVVIIRGDGMR